ncbi:MAG TPA: DHHA1 domain-containing protein, partial [Candidatus Limnocylindria bacterium]|nr:DHHA1 domain-containing protein [Candidatus Limnocylindria bacterium]
NGMRVALMFNEHDAGAIKVSCRTSAWVPSVDASALMARFGGGGHVRAAGALVSGRVDEVRENVLRAAREALADARAARPVGIA